MKIFFYILSAVFGILPFCPIFADEPMEPELLDARLNYELYRQEGKYAIVIDSSYPRDQNGNEIDCRWIKDGEEWISGLNHFEAIVLGDNVTIRSNRGVMSWTADPEISGKSLNLLGIKRLGIDPFGPKYAGNILEYDYGNIKRYLRIVEGNITSTWIANNPINGELRINIENAGEKLIPGKALDADGLEIPVNMDKTTEIINSSCLNTAKYPIYINDSPLTFYPDPDPEASTVDGEVYRVNVKETWATKHDNTGTNASPSGVTGRALIGGSNTAGQYWFIMRSAFLFDTSLIPDTAIISSASLFLYGSNKLDNMSISPTINIYTSNPASNTDLVNGDYLHTLWGETDLSSDINYVGYNASGFNEFPLNASGIAVIDKEGITKLGARESTYDSNDVDPGWGGAGNLDSGFQFYCSEQGSSYSPKLVVFYTVPSVYAPTKLKFTQNSVQGGLLEWVKGIGCDNTTIQLSYSDNYGYYTTNTSGSDYTLTGLDLNSTVYTAYLKGYNVDVESDWASISFGGDDMAIEIPLAIYALILALGLTIANIWLKSPLLWLAISVVWFGFYHEEELWDTYYQVAIYIAILFCWTMAFFNFRSKRRDQQG